MWLCPSFGFFSQLQLRLFLRSFSDEALHYCSTDIPALQIQPQITGDPLIAWVLPKISRFLGLGEKIPGKLLKLSISFLYSALKNHKYIQLCYIYYFLLVYQLIYIFFIFLLILHFFIFLGIQLRNDQDYFITLFQFFIYQFFWCILSYQVQSYEAIIQKKLSTTAFLDTSLDCCDWTRLR